jgi:transcriptional regulator with XRE-family HTH domain
VITGQDLRMVREAQGVGLGKLAVRIGRSKGHLSKVERGVDDRAVTPALVRDYERALGVTVPKPSASTTAR